MPDPPNVYVTLTGAPPNDSIPPNRIFAAVAMPPPQYCENEANPPPPCDGIPPHFSGLGQAPPQPPTPAPSASASMPGFPGMAYPPYYSPYATLPGVIPMAVPGFYPGYFVGYPMPLPIYPGLQPQPQPPPAPAPVAETPPPPSQQPPYEPPGQCASQNGSGYTILGTPDMCTIHFINDGSRPCDSYPQPFKHTFNFSVHQTLCSLTIKELLGLLGCPEERGMGVTTLMELGDDSWVEGDSFMYGEGEERKLAEVGWVKGRTVWICVKR